MCVLIIVQGFALDCLNKTVTGLWELLYWHWVMTLSVFIKKRRKKTLNISLFVFCFCTQACAVLDFPLKCIVTIAEIWQRGGVKLLELNSFEWLQSVVGVIFVRGQFQGLVKCLCQIILCFIFTDFLHYFILLISKALQSFDFLPFLAL